MYCPLCAKALQAVERQGVEIDWCSQCGGLWLDQGELTELVRRETEAALLRGQQALNRERNDREFDMNLETTNEMVAFDLPSENAHNLSTPFATSRGVTLVSTVR